MVAKFKKRIKTSFSESIFFSILVGIFIFGIVGFLIFQNFRVNQKRTKLFSQIEILRQEIQELEEKNDFLGAGISQVGDGEYIERVAREELNQQKEGEKVVGFILPDENTREKEEKSFWNPKTWWQWITEKVRD